jgi:Flp pilus assembly protein CpaB
VAIVCGLGAAYLVAKLMSSQPSEESVKVLVAKTRGTAIEEDDEITQGTLLKGVWDKQAPDGLQANNSYFEFRNYQKGQEPKNAINDPEKLEGRIMGKALPAGQFVTEADLVPKDKVVEIPFDKQGNPMVAMAVKVNPEQSTGGFVKPHTYVDVVYTEQVPGTSKSRTRKILFDVQVLGIDNMSEIPPDKKGTNGYNANTVTLALTREQAERLALAAERGRFTFTLLPKSWWGDEKKALERKKNGEYIGDDAVEADQNPQKTKVNVWVAKAAIAPTAVLEKDLFAPVEFDKGEEPPNVVSDLPGFLDRNQGRKLRKTLAAGKWLTQDALDDPRGDADPIPARQPPSLLSIKNGQQEVHWFFREPGVPAERVETAANSESQTPNVKKEGGIWEIDGEDLGGAKLKLSSMRGKIVVLTFWADSSEHSRALARSLRDLAGKLDKGADGDAVVFLGVNVDSSIEKAKKAVAAKRLPGQSWWDEGGELCKTMQVKDLPTVLILDGKGTERFKFIGVPKDKQALEEDVLHLVQERKQVKEAAEK